MRPVIFVAPYFLDATLRFIDAVSRLDDAALAIVSTDPEDRLPPGLRSRMHAHWRVDDCLDADQLEAAVRGLSAKLGPSARLIGTLEELQVPLAICRERLGLPGLPAEAARNFRDKARMKTVFEAHGIPCARHRAVESTDAALAFAREVGYPLVVKPLAGAGARSTFRVDGEPELGQALALLPPAPAQPVLLEEFVVGEEHSFDAVVVDGKPAWYSVSRYFPSPLEVLREPWIQWCVVLPRAVDGPAYGPIREAGFGALAALGLSTGLAHMEWFRRANGAVAVSEVGARPPGAQFMSLLSYAHDTDLYRAWARLAVFDKFDAPERKFAVGCAYLRGQGEGRVRALRGLEQVAREVGPLVVEARLPEPGQAPKGGYEGDGHIIVRHPDTAVVEKALTTIVSNLRVELA